MRPIVSGRTLIYLCSLFYAVTSIGAISFNVAGRAREVSNLRKRAIVPGAFGNGSSSLMDATDVTYSCNITLGGARFEVIIDTGSADLWLYAGIFSVPGTVNTTTPLNLTYGVGSVAGFINTVTLVFDDYSVDDQSYLLVDTLVEQSNAPGTGLIGLGPSSGSKIFNTLGASAGDTPLDRIFKQNPSTPNILTILLSRTPENSTAFNMSDTLIPLLDDQPGQITIGDVVPEYENITNQAKLPALVDTINQHWLTILDSNGIIGPDGKHLNTTSAQTNLTQGQSDQLRVVFDSGFSRPQVPSAVTDAFYGRVPGAVWIEEATLWEVPCDYELNVTFIFAGVEYPIHPLDLTQFLGVNETSGADICAGWFQPLAENIATDPSFGAFDAILGMAFLRNAYLLTNYGDFVEGSNSTAAPFIQLLPTLNRTDAHLDFVNTRLGGKDTTGSQATLLPVTQGKTSSAASANTAASDALSEDLSSDNDDSHTASRPIYKNTWFIVVVSVAGAIVLALLGWIAYKLSQRTRRSNVRSENAFVPPMGSYKPLIMKDEDGSNIRVLPSQFKDHETGSGYHDPYSDDPHRQ